MASRSANKVKKSSVNRKRTSGNKSMVAMQLTTVLPRKYSATKRKKLKELERQYLSGIIK